MKRIGILTYHRSINYGAFMQCYSLVNKLKQDFSGNDFEVIDYVTEMSYNRYIPSLSNYLNSGSRLKQLGKLLFSPKQIYYKKSIYEAFQKDLVRLPLSSDYWISDSPTRFYNDIKGKYDIIIVGSDCIWEYKHYPFPSAYFLCEDIDSIKMSYAASVDRMHSSEISESERDYLAKAWGAFSYLGVRDISTENFMKSISSSLNYSHNCDPSFLLDLNSLHDYQLRAKKKLISRGIDVSKPIIGIMGGDKLGALIRSHFGKDFQIVSLFYNNRYADAFMNDLTPLEWATIFSFFNLTVTRFFHGSIYSLINGTPTITVDDWWSHDSHHLSKLADLYNRLKLDGHLFKASLLDSEQGRNIIVKAACSFLDRPDTDKIAESVYRESLSYCSFKEALDIILSK